MKKNLPVNNREVDYPESLNILSTTNARGLISYCNKDFIKISGFGEEELVGRSHNIVRHPDMPAPAFKDLWKHMHSKRSWMGIVKNRCKDGSYYWVDAFATPIFENGKLIECQSVRTKPKRDCVQRADVLYKQLNQGKSTPLSRPSIPILVQCFLAFIIGVLPGLLAMYFNLSFSSIFLVNVIGVLLGLSALAFALNPLKKIIQQSKNIVDNKLMQYVYTGRVDDFGRIQLAMKMLSSELGAVVGRMHDMSQNQMESATHTLNNMRVSSESTSQQKEETNSVATCVEEMNASMKEISKGASSASQFAVNASGLAETSSASITQLNELSNSIGNIIQMITSIAEQTNLLALNATIEAARAGEAGKGFAVVANEVKELAKQTGKATDEVSSKIQGIQAATQESMGNIKKVCEVIQDINHYQSSIASAVEEQSAVVSEMARNISRISVSTTETARMVKETEAHSLNLANEVGSSKRLADEFKSSILARNSGAASKAALISDNHESLKEMN